MKTLDGRWKETESDDTAGIFADMQLQVLKAEHMKYKTEQTR